MFTTLVKFDAPLENGRLIRYILLTTPKELVWATPWSRSEWKLLLTKDAQSVETPLTVSTLHQLRLELIYGTLVASQSGGGWTTTGALLFKIPYALPTPVVEHLDLRCARGVLDLVADVLIVTGGGLGFRNG